MTLADLKDLARKAEESRLEERDRNGRLPVGIPESRHNAGIHYFKWPSLNLAVRVDRLHEDSKYTVTGELTIQALPEGHLHQSRINLTSPRARADVVRFLAQRHEGIDWAVIVEQICVQVLKAHREGEPVVRLRDVEYSDSLAYRLEPFIVEQEANLIYGYGGLGKSLIAAYFAIAVDRGIIAPRENLRAEKGPVLYVDYETRKEIAARRFRLIERGLGLDDGPDILYRRFEQPVANEVERLQRIVAEYDIQLAIIDSAAPACGGEPEAASATIQYFAALRSLKIATLTIAHRAKNTAGPGPFGSVYWVNYPRNVFEIKKAQEVGDDRISVALVHQKANDTRLEKPFGFQIAFSDNAISISAQDIKDVPEFDEERSLRERVAETLANGRMKVAELVEELGAKPISVRQALNRGKDKDFIKLGEYWGLLAHPSDR